MFFSFLNLEFIRIFFHLSTLFIGSAFINNYFY